MRRTHAGLSIALLVCWGLFAPRTSIAREKQPSQLIADRFQVTVTWRDHAGQSGSGLPVLEGQSRTSAIFSFFDEDNWELMVKVLDGCRLNGHHWVFASASTDVEFTLEVTDLDSGETATYHNPLGRAAAAITDTTALDGCGSGSGDPFRLRRIRTETELGDVLKRGLLETYTGSSPFLFGPFLGGGGPSGGPSAPAPDAGPQIDVSQTNVQEVGVDEEDRIKSDGGHLYILENHQSLRARPGQIGGDRIRILELDASAPSAVELSELELELGEGESARGLYLRPDADQLIVTAASYQFGWFFWFSPLAWLGATSTVASIAVGDPAQPVQEATLTLDGEIIASRRIEGVLYLATRFHPAIPGLEPFAPNDSRAAQMKERIERASISDLLPSVRSGPRGASRPLVSARDCYLPTEDAPIREADVITLVAIRLDTMEVSSSKCFVGATETLYASLDSIYVASTRDDYTLELGEDGAPRIDYAEPSVATDLHKFSLVGGQIVYRASGSVDGHLGWNLTRRPFRLSESGSDLRTITYTAELTETESPVAITVLRDTGDDELQVLATLPNQDHPEPIGKPGEELYATRFVGDRAYLVTFQITDPLYVVDLSDPANPRVAGELEITGYSDYLHPLEGGYLLGVGKDAIPDPLGDFRGAWYQGVKVALYDVRDPADPREVDAVVLGKRGSETPVLYDHRAFTYLPGSAQRRPRFAFGTTIHERRQGPSRNPSTFYGWSYSGLQLFEADTTRGRLINRGAVVVEEHANGKPGPIWGDDRAVLAGDAIFYVHGDDVHVATWSAPESPQGPN